MLHSVGIQPRFVQAVIITDGVGCNRGAPLAPKINARRRVDVSTAGRVKIAEIEGEVVAQEATLIF